MKLGCARQQTVPVGDSARAALGDGARDGHEPSRAAPPRALPCRRATDGGQPAATGDTSAQGKLLGIDIFTKC